MKIKTLIIFVVIVILGCKKTPPEPPENPAEFENGIVALNEGLFEQNNATLSFYSNENGEEFQQVFQTENGRGLGDTANDFEAYSLDGEDYIIIAVDVSSQVEIIERFTLKTVAQIPIFNGANGRSPRRVKVYGRNAFVCNFDGTVAVISLDTYTIEAIVEVGANPDGLLTIDNRLYVVNSGGLNFPVYDSTISVIDMDTKAVISTFETRINAAQIDLDSEGEIYLLSRGNHSDISPALMRIDPSTENVLETIEKPISTITTAGDWLYYYDTEEKGVFRINTITEVSDPTRLIDGSGFETFFGIHIDLVKNRIYCVDANGYVNSSTIRVYDLTGTFQFEFQGGLNANNLIFNN